MYDEIHQKNNAAFQSTEYCHDGMVQRQRAEFTASPTAITANSGPSRLIVKRRQHERVWRGILDR